MKTDTQTDTQTENETATVEVNTSAIPTPAKIAGKRGKKRMDVTLVFNEPQMTIKQIAEASKVSPALTYLRIREMIGAGKVAIVGSHRKEGAKGKATIIYGKTESFA
jgi:hypothetical protein